MKIVGPSFEILNATPDLEKTIEIAGRTCYKSEDRITDSSAERFIEDVCFKRHHESIMEHGAITVKIVCDRGVTHEIVRHRIAAYSQESTRYCNYTKDKFSNEITVIDIATGFKYDMTNPTDIAKYEVWREAMGHAENAYNKLISLGAKPQEARSVLPNSTKTEIVITTNPREWRHIFRLRCDSNAHPQMIEVMDMVHEEFAKRWKTLFSNK